jgi:hypothetical protein
MKYIIKSDQDVFSDGRRNLEVVLLLGIVILSLLLIFPPKMQVPIEEQTQTTINFIIPQDFNIIFYDYDNQTEINRYNYSLYILSVSGKEFYNDSIGHNQNFIDQVLLSWFLDVEIYNMSFLKPEHIFNGKNLTLSFTHNDTNEFFIIEACDLSLWNGTNNYNMADFGNTPFMKIPLATSTDVYLNNLVCNRIGFNQFRPFLNYTVNGETNYEKMAWNNTFFI